MEKIYRVFISSTYEDLQEERKKVTQALLGIDCVPTGMEVFQASDDDQWNLIKRVINSCDYYIVIVGGRYGSIHPKTKKSYTQMEYEYALKIGIPIVGFIYSGIKRLPWNKIDNISKLEEFINLVETKMVAYWSTSEELVSCVLLSIYKITSTHPRPGWVKANILENDLACAKKIHSMVNSTPATSIKTNINGYWYSRLMELSNISFGGGISAISNFFNEKTKAYIPKLEIVEIGHLDLIFPINTYHVSYSIESPFKGLIILCLEKDYINHYIKSNIKCHHPIIQYSISLPNELGSMFSGAFTTNLSDIIHSRIDIQKCDLPLIKVFSKTDTLLFASQKFYSDYAAFNSYFFAEIFTFDQILPL